MRSRHRFKYPLLIVLLVALLSGCASSPADTPSTDPLPSWNPGPTKTAIVGFVAAVTDPDHPDFVPARDRIATFDNDGTLWAEKPSYVQAAFIMARLQQLLPDHPEWQTTPPFSVLLNEGPDGFRKLTPQDWIPLLSATHGGVTNAEFEQIAGEFLATSRDPRFGVPYTELTYRPMLELLDYLRNHDFRVFIVSGGDIGFIRSRSEQIYGVPRENVIGSSMNYAYSEVSGKAEIHYVEGLRSFNNGPRKPVNIWLHIGRQPIMAVGNSNGDIEMLRYASDNPGRSLALLLHHDDAAREYDYDRGTAKALALAAEQGWQVVSIARDFATVFSFQAR